MDNESAIRPNTIVRFDPKMEKFQSWIILGGGGVVRNMSVFANGNIAMAESGVNRVALVEIPNSNARRNKVGFGGSVVRGEGFEPPYPRTIEPSTR